jgi:hypothetical protein
MILRVNVIFIFLVSCFYCTTVFSQNLPGYYISKEGDTIRGYVDYRTEKRNHKVLVFKNALDSDRLKLYPNQIRGFVVEDKDFYEKHTYKNRKEEELEGFFRVIFRGKIGLLRFRSKYYALDSAGRMFDLAENPRVTDLGRWKDFYRIGLMKTLLKDCPDLTRNLEKKYVNDEDVEAIVKDFYECTGLTFYRTRPIEIRPAFEFGLSASVAQSSLAFTGQDLGDAKFDKTIVPEFGAYVSIFVPRVSSNVRLIAEALYGQNNTYAFFVNQMYNNDFFAKYSYIRMPLYVRYFPSAFFVEGGLQAQFIVQQDIRWRREYVQAGSVDTAEMEPQNLPAASLGVIAGAGFKFYVGNLHIQPGIRFSSTYAFESSYKPRFQALEFNLKLGLRKK